VKRFHVPGCPQHVSELAPPSLPLSRRTRATPAISKCDQVVEIEVLNSSIRNPRSVAGSFRAMWLMRKPFFMWMFTFQVPPANILGQLPPKKPAITKYCDTT